MQGKLLSPSGLHGSTNMTKPHPETWKLYRRHLPKTLGKPNLGSYLRQSLLRDDLRQRREAREKRAAERARSTATDEGSKKHRQREQEKDGAQATRDAEERGLPVEIVDQLCDDVGSANEVSEALLAERAALAELIKHAGAFCKCVREVHQLDQARAKRLPQSSAYDDKAGVKLVIAEQVLRMVTKLGNQASSSPMSGSPTATEWLIRRAINLAVGPLEVTIADALVAVERGKNNTSQVGLGSTMLLDHSSKLARQRWTKAFLKHLKAADKAAREKASSPAKEPTKPTTSKSSTTAKPVLGATKKAAVSATKASQRVEGKPSSRGKK
jgi:hypothetical protein